MLVPRYQGHEAVIARAVMGVFAGLRGVVVVLACALMPVTAGAALSPANLMPMVSLERPFSSSGCLEYRIIGYCGPPWDPGLVITHFLPSALVEVTKSPGESIFFDTGGTSMGTVVSDGTGAGPRHGWEVRVWDISAVADYIAERVCVACQLDGLMSHTGSIGDAVPSSGENGGFASAMERLGMTSVSTEDMSICGLTDRAINQALGEVNRGMEWIKLVYTSELDIINWRTGCRDFMRGFEATKCGLTGGVEDVFSSVPDDILPDDVAGGLFDGLGGTAGCLGSWGSVYPRQMTAMNSQQIASSLTAYRGLHVARHAMDSFGYPVSQRGKLQPAYPNVERCYHPGASVSQVEINRADFRTTNETKYGFLWWNRVTCCRTYSMVMSCFSGGGMLGDLGSMEGAQGGVSAVQGLGSVASGLDFGASALFGGSGGSAASYTEIINRALEFTTRAAGGDEGSR